MSQLLELPDPLYAALKGQRRPAARLPKVGLLLICPPQGTGTDRVDIKLSLRIVVRSSPTTCKRSGRRGICDFVR